MKLFQVSFLDWVILMCGPEASKGDYLYLVLAGL